MLRRGPSGTKAKGAHDMGREYRIQAALRTRLPLCGNDGRVLRRPGRASAADFYVMERLVGTVPRRELPVELSPDQASRAVRAHARRPRRAARRRPGAGGLDTLGKGEGYVRRQVEGWSARYRRAHTDGQPDLEHAMAWLDEHQPDDVRSCVIHNDYKLDNLVLDRGRPDPDRRASSTGRWPPSATR